MKVPSAAFALLVLGAAPAYPQVINGESTYEDNFEHVPPAEQAADSGSQKTGEKAPPPKAGTSRASRGHE